MAVIPVMYILGGKDISLAKVVSGEKVSSEEFTIWVATTDILCPTAGKIFETFPFSSLMPCFFSLSKDEASLVTKAPKGQWVWLPVLSLTSSALIVLGSASATKGPSGSSGCKCLPEGFTPRNSPLLPSPLVPGWPLPILLLSASTTFRHFCLFCYGDCLLLALYIPYLSFRLHTHSVSSVYRCLPSTQATSPLRTGTKSSWFAAVFLGS